MHATERTDIDRGGAAHAGERINGHHGDFPSVLSGPAGVFARAAGHEQVLHVAHPSGLRAIVAVHSTALGPAFGGTRLVDRPDESAALDDVLRRSRTMSYRNALAGLDFGGGAAVILGASGRCGSEPVLRAFGRFLQSLAGRFLTACDAGTRPADMAMMARETGYVTVGDPAPLTAYGVMLALAAATEVVWDGAPLAGRSVGVQGAGAVGGRVVDRLVDAGADVLVHDDDPAVVRALRSRHPRVRVAPDVDSLVRADLDVFMPCGPSGTLTEPVARALTAEIVCGAADNQFATPGVEAVLADRGVLHVPDPLAGAGGAIHAACELEGLGPAVARAEAARIYDTTKRVLRHAHALSILPGATADLLAEERMAAVSQVRTIHVPSRPTEHPGGCCCDPPARGRFTRR